MIWRRNSPLRSSSYHMRTGWWTICSGNYRYVSVFFLHIVHCAGMSNFFRAVFGKKSCQIIGFPSPLEILEPQLRGSSGRERGPKLSSIFFEIDSNNSIICYRRNPSSTWIDWNLPAERRRKPQSGELQQLLGIIVKHGFPILSKCVWYCTQNTPLCHEWIYETEIWRKRKSGQWRITAKIWLKTSFCQLSRNAFKMLSLLAKIANLAVQSSTRTLILNAILFKDTTTMLNIYNLAHSLIGKRYLTIVASNAEVPYHSCGWGSGET